MVVALFLAVAACSAGSAAVSEGGETSSPDASADEVSEAARGQLDWFLGVLAGEEVTATEYEQRFTVEFRDAVPLAQFQQTNDMLSANAPHALGKVSPDGPAGLTAVMTGADGAHTQVSLSVDAGGLIDLLALNPVLDEVPTTISAAADRLEAFGELRLVAATVEGTACTADVDRGATTPAPIGSLFKLYVLAAVVDAIAAGELSWDDQVEITADDRSLPGGELYERADGSMVSVREAAELMISISDNTAADLLLRTVGREAVETAQATYGHSSPERNNPFPTTRELSILKLIDDAALRQAWVDGNSDTRRAILADIADVDLTSLLGDDDDRPVRPDTIEWFASPMDLCRAMATLLDRAEEPGLEPVRDILTTNPGVPGPPGRWSTIAFKGGSESGLLAAGWLVESPSGARRALVASVVNPNEPLEPEQEVTLLMAAARDLLPDR